jgi:RecB family exonuclease
MKLTNKHGIPDTFLNVLKRPTYSKGKAHLSATQLLNSPKIVALTKKFEEELEQDVSDMVWSIFGTAIHGVLEHGKDDNHIVEERLHTTFDGWRISGAIDLQIITGQDTVSIRDYKTTSAWAVMNEKYEWEQQLNIYAWLVETVKLQDRGLRRYRGHHS